MNDTRGSERVTRGLRVFAELGARRAVLEGLTFGAVKLLKVLAGCIAACGISRQLPYRRFRRASEENEREDEENAFHAAWLQGSQPPIMAMKSNESSLSITSGET